MSASEGSDTETLTSLPDGVRRFCCWICCASKMSFAFCSGGNSSSCRRGWNMLMRAHVRFHSAQGGGRVASLGYGSATDGGGGGRKMPPVDMTSSMFFSDSRTASASISLPSMCMYLSR